MSKFRTIIALSPGFIKVMPFRCVGVNDLKFESYTNSFEEVNEGLVCIFKAENDNTGPVRVQLSKMSKELRMINSEGEELPSGTIKANRFYQASYDGVDLILHTDDSNMDIEAGTNIIIDKKPNGNIVINSIDTNTWRPISDSLNSNDSNTSASSNVARVLNEKIEALKVIVEENGKLQDNIADTVIDILAEIENLKIVDSNTSSKILEVDNKVNTNIRDIVAIKEELLTKGDIPIFATDSDIDSLFL